MTITITGSSNIVGDHNISIKELTTTGNVNLIFGGDYQPLSIAYLDPWPIYESVDWELFERRSWLEEQIEAFTRQHSRGYFILEAEAGVGKTAFLAELVRRCGFVHHFVELAPGQDGIVPGLKSLTAQLVRAYFPASQVAGILEMIKGQLPVSPKEDLPGPLSSHAAAYTNYLLYLLRRVSQNCPSEQIMVVIDGLEVAGTPTGQNVLGLPNILPEGVFLLVSRRPVPINLFIHPETPCRKVRLQADEPNNLADMRRYLRKAVTRNSAVQEALTRCHCAENWFVDAVIDKCAGVWIYAQYILYEIEQGKRSPLDLASLPAHLSQYYALYWQRWRQDREKWYKSYLPILGMLTAARKSVCANDLLAWTGVGMPEAALHRLLSEDWRDFVMPVKEHCYKFTHTTLYDFCEGRAGQEDQAGQNLIDELKRATISCALRLLHQAPDKIRRDAAFTLARMGNG